MPLFAHYGLLESAGASTALLWALWPLNVALSVFAELINLAYFACVAPAAKLAIPAGATALSVALASTRRAAKAT